MKRIILFFSLMAATIAYSWAAPADNRIVELRDAITAGDLTDAEDMANALYAQKATCSASELAELAIVYHRLAEKSGDPISKYDFVLKVIDCHKEAKAKDAAAATSAYKKAGLNFDKIVTDYTARIDALRQEAANGFSF